MVNKLKILSDPHCDLKLVRMIFDKISFMRRGFKNDKKIDLNMNVKIAENDEQKDLFKVTLIVEAIKENEYDIEIQITGFFSVSNSEPDIKNSLLNQNAVAILLPYVRSEISLLTAQPETECVVIPPFNIKKLME